MPNFRQYIFLFTVLFLPISVFTQNEFYKSFTTNILANFENAGIEVMSNNNGYSINFHTIDTSGKTFAEIMSFNTCDELKWHKKLNIDHVYDIAYLESKLVVMGVVYDGSSFGNNIIALLDEEGELLTSVRIIDVDSGGTFNILSMMTYDDGSILVTGNYSLSKSSATLFMAKFNPSFQLEWSNFYYNLLSWQYKTTLTSDGGVLVSWGNTGIMKIDSSGLFSWLHHIKGIYFATHFNARPIEVEGGYVFASGLRQNDLKTFLYKVDTDDQLVWTSDLLTMWPYRNQLAVNPSNGHIFLVSSEPKSAFYPKFGYSISELDPNGKLLKQVEWEINSDAQYSYESGISFMHDEYLMLTGFQGDTVNPQNSDVFLIKTKSIDSLIDCGFQSVFIKEDPVNIELNYFQIEVEAATASVMKIDLEVSDAKAQTTIHCFRENPFDLKIDLGKDITICFNDTVEITAKENLPYYLWSTGDSTQSIVVSDTGEYILSAGYDCFQLSDTIHVYYYPETDFGFNISPTKATPLDGVKFTSLSSDVDSLYWTIDGDIWKDSIFKKYFNQNGRHPVHYTTTNIYGCQRSDSGYVDIKFESFYMPNSFTPNGDDINNTFGPVGFGIKYFELEVYNRWGDLIFKGENQVWNGGKAPNGYYVYYIKLTNDFNEVSECKGGFSLLR